MAAAQWHLPAKSSVCNAAACHIEAGKAAAVDTGCLICTCIVQYLLTLLLAGPALLSATCHFIASSPAFTLAISSICLKKHRNSLQPRTAAAPAFVAPNSPASSTHFDAILNSLLQVVLQPLTTVQCCGDDGDHRLQAAVNVSSSLEGPGMAGEPVGFSLTSASPDRFSLRLAADQAAQMLARNVLMAPHCGSNLPHSGKRQLQETSIFQICCTALLQSCDSQAPTKWLDCAWGAANILHIAAGEPEQRVLVRLMSPSPVLHLFILLPVGPCL